jgi:hypothetical protein
MEMCDKCAELEKKIERYRRLAFSINDRETIDRFNQLIKDTEAEKGEAPLGSRTVAIGTMLIRRGFRS